MLVTGEILGGAGLTSAIQSRIVEADALVALLTREEKIEGQETWRPTGWVNSEYISARARSQRAIALVEDLSRLTVRTLRANIFASTCSVHVRR